MATCIKTLILLHSDFEVNQVLTIQKANIREAFIQCSLSDKHGIRRLRQEVRKAVTWTIQCINQYT